MAYKKYFTLSFDDGLEQDKQIIRILKEFGMRGCTFNLNGGLLGQKRAMGRISEYGFTEKEDLSLIGRKKGLVHYVQDFRIPADEIAQVYEGFEVASHAFRHENLKKLSAAELDASIGQDMETLQKLTGKPVAGFAYPFGAVSDKAIEVLKRHGIRYARTTVSSKGFYLPIDPLRLQPTCWIGQKETFDLVKRFIETAPTEKDQMLYIWGHGYEFDYGTKLNSWENLKRLCEMIAKAADVCCVTNGEILA